MFRPLRRHWALTALIVLAMGLGIGATMTMVTVLHVMAGDPLPGRSDHLYYPHLEPAPASFLQADPGASFTWPDAMRLLHANRATHQAAMAPTRLAVAVDGGGHASFHAGRFVSAQFFAMFATPFAAGTAWSDGDDAAMARSVVLNGELARKLFGRASNAIGRSVHLQGHAFRVVGVLADWHPEPLFYGGASGDWAFRSDDAFFLPLATAMDLALPIGGGETCWGKGDRKSDECAWLQFWVHLDSPAQVASYTQFLGNDWQAQRRAGRPLLDMAPTLQRLPERLQALHLVPSNLRLQLWLAAAFFGVCLFNTVSLMLAKFMRRSSEIAIRRALGATRRDIFLLLGAEAVTLGVLGGVLGLACTQAGLWLIHRRPDAYAQLAQLDAPMVLLTILVALMASLLAGLVPAWRASRIAPALQFQGG